MLFSYFSAHASKKHLKNDLVDKKFVCRLHIFLWIRNVSCGMAWYIPKTTKTWGKWPMSKSNFLYILYQMLKNPSIVSGVLLILEFRTAVGAQVVFGAFRNYCIDGSLRLQLWLTFWYKWPNLLTRFNFLSKCHCRWQYWRLFKSFLKLPIALSAICIYLIYLTHVHV